MTDITERIFTVDCASHSCPREADGVDGLCSTCRQIRLQKSTGTLTKEAEWTRDVLQLATTLGWRTAHFRPAQTTKGWRTAVAGDGKGWPDLILVRDRLIVAELKNEVADLEEEQAEWIAALQVAGVETYVWRPQDLDDVMAVLLGPKGKDA